MANVEQTAFISYSREDAEFTLKLAEDLKAAGAAVWLDQLDIKPGDLWDSAVEQALINAQRLLIILSPASVASSNVQDEVSFALRKQKRIIPVLYRDCEVPFRLHRFQYVDFTHDHDRGLNALVRVLTIEPPRERGPGDPPQIAAISSDVEAGRAKEPTQLQATNQIPKPVPEQELPGPDPPSFAQRQPFVLESVRPRPPQQQVLRESDPRGPQENSRRKTPAYALISLAAFLCCVAVLLLLLVNADKLTRLSLTDHIYYLVLVSMGLTSAVFLFGVRPSSATYKGKLLGGTLRLGGSVVGAALVVVGGYFFIPKSPTFPVTVYVHGEAGPQDIVLRNSGRVLLKLGAEIVAQPIGENGQAFFPAIPGNFRGQEVQAWVDSDTYTSANTRARLDGPGIDLLVKRAIHHYKLAGTVSDATGNPLAGVRVALPEYHAERETDQDGRFELEVTADNQTAVDLVAQKQGYQTARLSPTLGDTGVNFSLQRSR